MSCTIIGDSIAVGVGELRRECGLYAKIGISSTAWLRRWGNIQIMGDVVLISLGTNDRWGDDTSNNLYRIRLELGEDKKVLWVLPANNRRIREIVLEISGEWGDKAIVLNSVSPDGLHPTASGYRAIADSF
jgi:lysophospholipase L1-like esterase